ncbi:MAG: biotin transporter BioY [Actinobacteria bacterium]|nr:biotin transporter BioY [Actinomycetota bacterium]MCL5069457.1 biotin transporter BioY [Actinomycetota bacterium]
MNNNTNPDISKKFLSSGSVNIADDSNFYMEIGSISIPAAESQSKTAKISYTLAFAVLMAISANTFVYLPFTPVPITMQVLTVLMSAIALGSRLAFLSQMQYILAGLLGAPVFAGFKSRFSAIMGPTGGYIIGFLAASFIAGYIYENNIVGTIVKSFRMTKPKNYAEFHDTRTISMFFSCIAGLLVIYLCGFIHLYGFIYMSGKAGGLLNIFEKTLKLGVIPFVIIDFLKILIIINLDKVFRIKDSLAKDIHN